METLKDFLWPIVAIGGLGAFIDFLIGRTGQQRAKDFLLKWWVRFDDVRWTNFGREEGLFAGRLMERWFGTKIWSLRRISIAFSLFNVFMLVAYLRSLISSTSASCGFCVGYISDGIILLTLSVIGFCLSMSFTKFITFRMADLCSVGKAQNFIIFILMLIINYFILVFWLPIMDAVKGLVTVSVTIHFTHFMRGYYAQGVMEALIDDWASAARRLKGDFDPLYPKMIARLFSETRTAVDVFAYYALSPFTSVLRLVLSIVFVSSFLLRPLIIRPVSLVWARIVESDKPVFTLIFGGAAAFASAISEAAKHL